MLGARPPLVGDPLQGCGPEAKTCATDAACGPGGVCLDGLCSWKCSNAEADCLHNDRLDWLDSATLGLVQIGLYKGKLGHSLVRLG